MNDEIETGTVDAVEAPTLADIEAAAARIAPHARRTPVMSSSALDDMLGASLHFKCARSSFAAHATRCSR